MGSRGGLRFRLAKSNRKALTVSFDVANAMASSEESVSSPVALGDSSTPGVLRDAGTFTIPENPEKYDLAATPSTPNNDAMLSTRLASIINDLRKFSVSVGGSI